MSGRGDGGDGSGIRGLAQSGPGGRDRGRPGGGDRGGPRDRNRNTATSQLGRKEKNVIDIIKSIDLLAVIDTCIIIFIKGKIIIYTKQDKRQ